eukprot:PhF_6_TR5124/c0_g1_i1/m.7265
MNELNTDFEATLEVPTLNTDTVTPDYHSMHESIVDIDYPEDFSTFGMEKAPPADPHPERSEDMIEAFNRFDQQREAFEQQRSKNVIQKKLETVEDQDDSAPLPVDDDIKTPSAIITNTQPQKKQTVKKISSPPKHKPQQQQHQKVKTQTTVVKLKHSPAKHHNHHVTKINVVQSHHHSKPAQPLTAKSSQHHHHHHIHVTKVIHIHHHHHHHHHHPVVAMKPPTDYNSCKNICINTLKAAGGDPANCSSHK